MSMWCVYVVYVWYMCGLHVWCVCVMYMCVRERERCGGVVCVHCVCGVLWHMCVHDMYGMLVGVYVWCVCERERGRETWSAVCVMCVCVFI